MSTTTPNYGWILPGVNDPTDADLWGGYLNSNLSNQDTVVKNISDTANAALAASNIAAPIGVVYPFAGSSAPTSHLLCYGQAISRSTYSGLFAVIGTTYGAGDGSTTFNLPDLRGRAVAGKDNMGGTSANRLTTPIDGDVLGAAGGEEGVTLVRANLPNVGIESGILHKGPSPSVYSTTTTGTPGAATVAHDSGYTANLTSSFQPVTAPLGSSTAHANIQPTLVLNYIIRAL